MERNGMLYFCSPLLASLHLDTFVPRAPTYWFYTVFHCRTKLEMCKDLDAQVLIDDSIAYAVECAAVLPVVILFGAYAWNKVADDGTILSPTHTPVSHGEAPTSLPRNVVRALNWRHVAALLARLRHKIDKRSTPGSARGQYTTASANPLGIREAITINTVSAPSAAVVSPVAYADQIRRQFEVQSCIDITATGYDTRIVLETADVLVRSRDATLGQLRTGAESAPPHRPRFPRLTISLRRSPEFLDRRFRARGELASIAPAELNASKDEAAQALSSPTH
jgi:hypothetical protein